MRKISLWILISAFAIATTASVRAQQEDATQQQLDKISGQIQDLIDAQAVQGKRIDALEKEISELRDKANTPAVSDSASVEDLKKLADDVREIDKKRQDDKELILNEIEKVSKITAGSGGKKASQASAETPPAGPMKGYDYVVKAGDTLGIIAKAYRDQGVKVTTGQILKANPGLDPNKLYIGKKIFIPDPNAK